MQPDAIEERVLVECTRRADRREDPAARRVQLLVRRAGRAQRELLDPVAAERGMRVTVDEARHGAEPAAVELLDLVRQGRQVAHPADRLDAPGAAEQIRVVDHVDVGERTPTQRQDALHRGRELREPANQEVGHR